MSTREVLKKGTGNRWEMRFLQTPQNLRLPTLTPEKGQAAQSKCVLTQMYKERARMDRDRVNVQVTK